MAEPGQNTTYTEGGLTLYDQARVAGFSEDEVKHLKPPEPEQPEKPEQAAPEAPAPTKTTSAVPPPPEPVPGVYNPEQQQNALRAADSIADPEMRMKVKSNLKREYANDAMMDGITAKAREEGTKKAVSSYSTAVQQLRDDPKMPLAQKQALVKMLTKTMWQDPRTDYGETRGHLEQFMQKIAFGEDQDDLGSKYIDAFHGVVTGKLTTSQQALEMMDRGDLTWKGGQKIIQALNTKDKPDQAAIHTRMALANDQIKVTVLKDVDENLGMKPSPKQSIKVNDVLRALNTEILGAGGDLDKIAKITSSEHVKDLIEQVYPLYERNVDYMSRGASLNLGGITIPPTVPQDERAQTAYRDIVALPPSIADKDGKTKQVPQENWQQAIEILRQTRNVAAFDKKFPGKDGAYILKSIPYVTPPPGSNPPVVQPAQAPSFWSVMGSRLFPPASEGVKSLQLDTGETPISDAITKGLNVIAPVPQEAKK